MLRTYKLAESDRICVLLTREHGKVRAVAHGVRKTSPRLGARMEVLDHVDVQLARGRTELLSVSQVEPLGATELDPRRLLPPLAGDGPRRGRRRRDDRAPGGPRVLRDGPPRAGLAPRPPRTPRVVATAFLLKTLVHDGAGTGARPLRVVRRGRPSSSPSTSPRAASCAASCRRGRPVSAAAVDAAAPDAPRRPRGRPRRGPARGGRPRSPRSRSTRWRPTSGAACAPRASSSALTDRCAPARTAPFGVYVHVPFCRARCDYCAFATWTDRDELMGAYVDALHRELARRRARGAIRRAATSVFFGGGTPSRLAAEDLCGVLAAIERPRAPRSPSSATPRTSTRPGSAPTAAPGVTRMSLGIQSTSARVLASLGRRHGTGALERAAAAVGRRRLRVLERRPHHRGHRRARRGPRSDARRRAPPRAAPAARERVRPHPRAGHPARRRPRPAPRRRRRGAPLRGWSTRG